MATKHTQDFDSTTFREAIAGSDLPVLVDFHADWCPPCKVLGPTVEALAKEYAGRALIGKVDVDAHKGLAQEFDVKTIPTVLIFFGGKVVGRFVGITSQDELADALNSASASIVA